MTEKLELYRCEICSDQRNGRHGCRTGMGISEASAAQLVGKPEGAVLLHESCGGGGCQP